MYLKEQDLLLKCFLVNELKKIILQAPLHVTVSSFNNRILFEEWLKIQKCKTVAILQTEAGMHWLQAPTNSQ